MKPLQGKVAVVAGATRGAGRGIACMLGEAGATVYCTGRSVRGKPATANRPETIDETAEMVAARGGVGIAAQVDHTQPDQVQALFARVKAEQGKLDVLVNDIWGGEALTEWGTPFWELSLDKGLLMLQRAIHTHIITSRFGAPLMVARRAGLIVEITDGDTFAYRGNLFYDLVKTSVIRLAFGMATELREHEVAALAVTPGFLRSEEMLDHFGVTEANWQDAVQQEPHFIASETPYFVGRAVAALAADAKVMGKTGRVFGSWNLSDEYGFSDVDGRQPHWGRYFEATFGPQKTCDEGFYAYWGGNLMDMFSPDGMNAATETSPQ
ncbi:MAG: SDR family NAD(P)-dependent oxidoreductase [Chloroflexi bacterium]|nr:SDR family NAD(P)-dependent oxidoreductase [Chloroflexota bacterium]